MKDYFGRIPFQTNFQLYADLTKNDIWQISGIFSISVLNGWGGEVTFQHWESQLSYSVPQTEAYLCRVLVFYVFCFCLFVCLWIFSASDSSKPVCLQRILNTDRKDNIAYCKFLAQRAIAERSWWGAETWLRLERGMVAKIISFVRSVDRSFLSTWYYQGNVFS